MGLRDADGYRSQRARLVADGRAGYERQRAERTPDGPMCEDRPLSREDALEQLSQRLTFHILDHWQELAAMVESYELHRKGKAMGASWVIAQTRAHADLNAQALKPSSSFVTIGANARAAEEFTLRCVQRLSRRLPDPDEGFSYGEMEQIYEDARREADLRLEKEKGRAVSYYEEVMDNPEAWKRWPPFWAPETFRAGE
ncbi:MAG: hypothetical protein VX938_00045 [Myxococcota bacterium]|nr:hypothetical protein [Myxococcota bacterium]